MCLKSKTTTDVKWCITKWHLISFRTYSWGPCIRVTLESTKPTLKYNICIVSHTDT